MKDLFKRFLIILCLLAVCAAVLFAGVFAYRNAQNKKIENVLYKYTDEYISVFKTKEITDLAAEIEQMSAKMSEFLVGARYEKTVQTLSGALTYMSAGSKTVNEYEKDILSVSVDYRYGKVVATVRSYVKYDGWGEYITGETTDIKYNGVCVDTYRMEKEDGYWKISKIETEYE